MSGRKNFFFRQRVTEAELDSAFDDLEKADHDLAGDLGFVGILANAVVSPHAPVPDLTVDVSGPASILDARGRRIFFSSLQNVSVAQDDQGFATAVSAAGKEKIVSVFVRFERVLSDPRIDGNSLTVFFREDEGFQFVVAQGAEAVAGGAIPPPLRAEAILLADVARRFGQTQITAESISTARRQDALVVTGAPRSLRRGRPLEALSDLLAYHNAHVAGGADRHAAGAIDYGGAGAWADGTPNPATTVEAQLDKLVADLAGLTGAGKLGAQATSGAPLSLAPGSVKAQLDTLLAAQNAHLVDSDAAHLATSIAYAGGGPWKDGTPNPPATVEAQLDKLVADLAADAGAARIGAGARASWPDGVANPGGVSVHAALGKLVADLAAAAAEGEGAARIGARASGHLPAGSVRTQLDAIDATAVRTDVPNVFIASQTLNGPDGDTNPALTTTAAPALRKLLWQIAGVADGYRYRMYAARGTFELTVNARWDGAQWVKDTGASRSSKLELGPVEMRVSSDDGAASSFADTWPSTVSLELANHGTQRLDAGGNWISAGPTESYVGWQGPTGANATIVGAATSFRKAFPSPPSSITFVMLSSFNVVSGPVAVAPTAHGTGVTVGINPSGGAVLFFARVLAS